MPTVSLRGIGKRYRVYPSRQHRLREFFSLGKKEHGHDFWALEDVNLDVERGTTLGILGRNGAGKSTLLRIISGVIQPTAGTVEVNGRMAALFGVGAGFNPEFTGRENVMLNGLLLGIEYKEMLARFDEIEAFADIGAFIEQPIKTYSSGMRARLGFAVAVNVDPDILIVDETLSVGDAVFKQMSLQKMRDLREGGTTILFVSHSMDMVRNFCNKAILLHKGKLLAAGETNDALDRYQALVSSIKVQKNTGLEASEEPGYQVEGVEDPEDAVTFAEDPALDARKVGNFRHGTGEARVRNVEILGELGNPVEEIPSGTSVTVRVHLEYLKTLEGSVLGIILRNKAGIEVFSTNTALEKTHLGERSEGERVIVDFAFEAPLRPDSYSVAAYVSYAWDRKVYLDWIDVAAAVRISRSQEGGSVPGLVRLPAQVIVHKGNDERRDRSSA